MFDFFFVTRNSCAGPHCMAATAPSSVSGHKAQASSSAAAAAAAAAGDLPRVMYRAVAGSVKAGRRNDQDRIPLHPLGDDETIMDGIDLNEEEEEAKRKKNDARSEKRRLLARADQPS